jgi:hypothetical protein
MTAKDSWFTCLVFNYDTSFEEKKKKYFVSVAWSMLKNNINHFLEPHLKT